MRRLPSVMAKKSATSVMVPTADRMRRVVPAAGWSVLTGIHVFRSMAPMDRLVAQAIGAPIPMSAGVPGSRERIKKCVLADSTWSIPFKA